MEKESSGLEIRVVLWPQSTKTSVGPPAISMWWSGGLLKTLTIKKQCFDNFFKCADGPLTRNVNF